MHSNLLWTPSPLPSTIDENALKNCRSLIAQSTGEIYEVRSLRKIPAASNAGSLWMHGLSGELLGLLWVTPVNKARARLVVFAINEEYRGIGLGASGWKRMAEKLLETGFSKLQLEVHNDNSKAIQFYARRGMEVIGRLHGYYSRSDGLLMEGEIKEDPIEMHQPSTSLPNNSWDLSHSQ